jgi:hypothetical protein
MTWSTYANDMENEWEHNPITTIKWSYLCELVVGQEPI